MLLRIPNMERVFVSGSTGYLGTPLVGKLVWNRFEVTCLVRPGRKCSGFPVVGDALDALSFQEAVPMGGTFVHLVGTSKPAPWKGREFREVDQVALEASLRAAVAAEVKHFVYLSVAHPAPIMRDYISVRMECERMIRESGLNATFLRPWYVLGPGHWWPYVLKPLYSLAEKVDSQRENALRLGLVTRDEMTNALLWATMNPASGVRTLDVPAIRALHSVSS